jgi:hypothetical protein
MSDDEGASDVEVDNDLDDFDPLGENLDPEEKVDDSDPEDQGAEEDGAEELEARPAGGPPAPDQQTAWTCTSRRILVVPDEDRLTSNVMSQAEVARAIAIRAEQITRDPSSYTDGGGLTRAQEIARKEFFDHRSPLVLRRCVGRTPEGERIIEKWPVREMSYPPLN